MKKSFILYSEVDVEGELLECVYLVSDECRAQPLTSKIEGEIPYYKPSQEDLKIYCKDARNFRACPKYIGYQDDLKARGLEQERDLGEEGED